MGMVGGFDVRRIFALRRAVRRLAVGEVLIESATAAVSATNRPPPKMI